MAHGDPHTREAPAMGSGAKKRGLPRDVAPLCPPILPSQWRWSWSHLAPVCTPGLLQRWFLKNSLVVPSPAVPMALGWHRDRDAGSTQHQGAGGGAGAADSASQLPFAQSRISKDLQVWLSHPIPAAGSSTRCHPRQPSAPLALGKELTPEPCSAPVPHFLLKYFLLQQWVKDTRT